MERGYAVVTSCPTGPASLLIDLTLRLNDSRCRPLAVFLCAGFRPRSGRRAILERRLAKARRIGIIGALNGLRMRRWYNEDVQRLLCVRDVRELCAASGIPVIAISGFWDNAAQSSFRDIAPDLGVSLGNGFIPEAFFQVPKLGMINVHHELLPEYRGAQTAIWQIHDGSKRTGFSIHEMTTRIDAGRILLREEMPISFRKTLRDTVVNTVADVQRRSIERLVEVTMDFDRYRRGALPNQGGRLHTTPSGRALLRIYKNHARLRQSA